MGHPLKQWMGSNGEVELARLWRSVGRSLKAAGMFGYASVELAVKRPATRTERAEWLHRFCARVLQGMDVRVEVTGRYPESGALISNHIGYLDIMAYGALHRCVFVSKMEMLDEPVLGWMTKMAGTVFVERGRGGSAVQAKSGMQAAFDAGLPVVFFPEGTTSDGSAVLEFRSGLLGQTLEAKQPVTAAFVRYRLDEENGAEAKVGDDVCFWGEDAQLFRHVFRLVGLRGVVVEVKIADGPIQFSSDTLHRKEAADEAREAVMRLGGVLQGIGSREEGVEAGAGRI
jgi:lyso-ornithine lipid O-acyltransferase